MKRFFLMLIITITVGLAGCGSDSPRTTTAAKTNTAPGPATEVTQPAAPAKAAQAKAAPVKAAPAKAAPAKAAVVDSSYSTKRTEFVKEHGQAPKYKDSKNPLSPNTENITAGGILFRTRCALCHGNKGKGDGIAGGSLNPPPSDLSKIAAMKVATDGYLFWTISEGGGKLGTAMPTFNIMPKEERWQIILFLKSEIAGK